MAMPGKSGNLPGSGQVFLDHVGHFVAGAEACAAALGTLGFTATPFSAQTVPDPETGEPKLTGTGNVCVMLPSGYLEFLVHTADTPIGLEFKEALGRRAGLHLAAFAVPDAEAAHAGLSAAGWPMRPLVRMSRRVDTSTGTAEARFTVARLRKGTMPEGRIQLLTHGDDSALWQERWLDHPNTATGLSSLVISAPDPAEATGRFSRFLDRPAVRTDAGAYRIALDRGGVEFLEEPAASELIGTAVAPGASAIVGYRLAVTDLSAMLDRAARAGLPVRTVEGGAVVPFPSALGLGAWIVSQG